MKLKLDASREPSLPDELRWNAPSSLDKLQLKSKGKRGFTAKTDARSPRAEVRHDTALARAAGEYNAALVGVPPGDTAPIPCRGQSQLAHRQTILQPAYWPVKQMRMIVLTLAIDCSANRRLRPYCRRKQTPPTAAAYAARSAAPWRVPPVEPIRSPAVPERIHQCREGWRLLPPARIIEMVARERRCPIGKHTD